MGKILSILGVVFGVLGFLCALAIFVTLSGVPRTVEDTATLQVTKLTATISNLENATESISGSFDDLKNMMDSLSVSLESNAKAMVELGDGLDQAVTTLGALGVDTTKIEGTATLLKATDVSNVTNAASAFSSKMVDTKSSIEAMTGSISGMKSGMIRMRGTIVELSSTMSRAILFLSLFLMFVSLALIAFSVNAWQLQTGKKK